MSLGAGAVVGEAAAAAVGQDEAPESLAALAAKQQAFQLRQPDEMADILSRFIAQEAPQRAQLASVASICHALHILSHGAEVKVAFTVARAGSPPQLPALGEALARFGRKDRRVADGSAVCAMAERALAAVQSFPATGLRMLAGGSSGTVVVTRQQAHGLLALNFFCGVPPAPESKSTISLFGLFRKPAAARTFEVAVARIEAMLQYLLIADTGSPSAPKADRAGRIVIERRVLKNKVMWETMQRPVVRCDVIESGLVDASKASAQVDFANRLLHIGEVTASATQEEILFSVRPECFIAMLLGGGPMEDSEASRFVGALSSSLEW